MAPLTRYAQRRLIGATKAMFDEHVTGFITDAQLVACCCFGVTHGHIRENALGRFQDGHRIRTSDVMRVEQSGDYWSVFTKSGSHYVIATFNRHGGRQSLDTLLTLQRRVTHDSHYRFH